MSKKMSVEELKSIGLSAEQINVLVSQGVVVKQQVSQVKVVDYTTRAGKRSKYLSIPSARVFVKLEQAAEIVSLLTAGLKRAEAGTVDETKAARSSTEE